MTPVVTGIDSVYRPPAATQPPAPAAQAQPAEPQLAAPAGLFGSLVVLTCGCGALCLFLLAATTEQFERWTRVRAEPWNDGEALAFVVLLGSMTVTSFVMAGSAMWSAAACSSVAYRGAGPLLHRLRTLAVAAAAAALFLGGFMLWALVLH